MSWGAQNKMQAERNWHEQLWCHGDLEARLRLIDVNAATPEQKKIHEEVASILATLKADLDSWQGKSAFDEAPGWEAIWRADRLMVLLLGGTRLKRQLSARLLEMESAKAPEADLMKREYEKLEAELAQKPEANDGDTTRRVFLLGVLQSLAWFRGTETLIRSQHMIATTLISILLAIAIFLVVIGGFTPWVSEPLGSSRLPLYMVLTSGVAGSLFSRVIVLQRNWVIPLSEFLRHTKISYLLFRATFGVSAALLLYILLRSGIVAGGIFPNLDNFSKGAVSLIESKDLALLTVWSFIAGFSEVLVPSILEKTEERARTVETPGTVREGVIIEPR